MELNKYTTIGLTDLSNNELQDTNGGFIGFLIIGALALANTAARVAVVAAVGATISHIAKDGFDAGYKSAH